MKQPHLCLIEDDLIMGESLSDRFSLEGFTLDWYRRGSEAIDAMRDTQYAAVISHVRLPDVSGEQVFAVANESIGTPPFLFITAFASVESAVAMLKRGAVDYITKPFDITDSSARSGALWALTRNQLTLAIRLWGFRRA